MNELGRERPAAQPAAAAAVPAAPVARQEPAPVACARARPIPPATMPVRPAPAAMPSELAPGSLRRRRRLRPRTDAGPRTDAEPPRRRPAVRPPAAAPASVSEPRIVERPSRRPRPPQAPAAAATRWTGLPPPRLPPPPPRPPPAARAAFDWESLVGVKLFSAIAGRRARRRRRVLPALLDRGTAGCSRRSAWRSASSSRIALLVVCELKAARRYPATANALDAAAIAILFATFFAAHALWNLIPALVAFGLLAMVTAARRAAVDPARVALHRGARPARRLCHAGAALDRGEPARSRSSRICCC